MSDYDFDDPIYAQLQKEAAQDNRVGDHEFMVTDSVQDTWPDGQPRVKVRGVLTTANNAKADLTLSPPPSPEEVKSTIGTWSPGKKRAIAQSVTMHKALASWYKTTPEKISEGDTFKVKTVLTKRNADGTGGFVRVVAFLDPSKQLGAKAKKVDDGVPF